MHCTTSFFNARGAQNNRRMDFLAALAAIVVIDLVLAGDNAIVIALAARSLPKASAWASLLPARRGWRMDRAALAQ